MDNAWFVDYATDEWEHCYIVIHCPTKADVKPILKKHLGGEKFKINKLRKWTEEDSREWN